MAKNKNVYSTRFRNTLNKGKLNELSKQDEVFKVEQSARLAEEERERKLREIEEERMKERLSRSSEMMKRDFRADEDNLDDLYVYDENANYHREKIYENETPKQRKKRLKEEKIIAKNKAKLLAAEEKARQKALERRTKEEGDSKKNEEKVIDDDTQVRINMERQMIRLQRKKEAEERRALNSIEENLDDERRIQHKERQARERIISKDLEIEYKRLEKLRKEDEENRKRIQKKRRKAAGVTWYRTLYERIRIFTRIYSFQNLKDTINTYGYSYSFSDFLKQTIGIVVGVTFIAWYSKIRGTYLFTIVGLTALSVPFFLYSWFSQSFNGKKFEMVQSYLSNIIPVFMQKPKVRYALGEVADMSQGQMEVAIRHAIDYIDTASDDDNVMKTALSFIETEFPNSRIKAVHKLLLDIENGNSKDFTDICENMYVDIEAWIRRVYGFQKDLKNRRFSLIVLCVFSLVLNSVFTVMYSSNEIFNGFTDRPLYQIATSVFIILIILTIALVITRLHGSWLIYDSMEKEEAENAKAYIYIHMNKPDIKKKDLVTGIMLILIGLSIIIFMGNTAGSLTFVLAAMILTSNRTKWNSKKRRVSKALMLEFPVWLRGVALNLHDMTVINSIEDSMNTCSYCMAREIEKFFEIYDENPTSIRAFNEFLKDYQIDDVQATMKVLFTVQSMGAEDVQKQVAMLINRNQELLTKTETIQNQDSLGYAEMLGYAPMVLLTVQLLMSMVLMFIHIMEYMDEIMSTGLAG